MMLLKKFLTLCLVIILSTGSHAALDFSDKKDQRDFSSNTSETSHERPETGTSGVASIADDEGRAEESEIIVEECEIDLEVSEIILEESESSSPNESPDEAMPPESSEEPTESTVPKYNQYGSELSGLDIIYSDLNTPDFIGFYGTELPYLIIISNSAGHIFSTFTNPERFNFQQEGNRTNVSIDTHRDNPDGSKTLWIGGYWEIYIVGENFVTDGYCWKTIDLLPDDIAKYSPAQLSPLY